MRRFVFLFVVALPAWAQTPTVWRLGKVAGINEQQACQCSVVRRARASSFPASLVSGLVAYWAMTNSADGLGGHNGTVTGSVTFSTANGKVGAGAGFVTGAHFTLASTLASGAAWSMTAWVYPTAVPTFETVLAQDSQHGVFLSQNGANLSVNVYTSGSHSDTGLIAVNGWTHIAVVVGSGVTKIYRNGALSSTTAAYAPTYTFAEIGNDNAGEFFRGALDEVAVWNRSLADADIAADYNFGNGVTYP